MKGNLGKMYDMYIPVPGMTLVSEMQIMLGQGAMPAGQSLMPPPSGPAPAPR